MKNLAVTSGTTIMPIKSNLNSTPTSTFSSTGTNVSTTIMKMVQVNLYETTAKSLLVQGTTMSKAPESTTNTTSSINVFTTSRTLLNTTSTPRSAESAGSSVSHDAVLSTHHPTTHVATALTTKDKLTSTTSSVSNTSTYIAPVSNTSGTDDTTPDWHDPTMSRTFKKTATNILESTESKLGLSTTMGSPVGISSINILESTKKLSSETSPGTSYHLVSKQDAGSITGNLEVTTRSDHKAPTGSNLDFTTTRFPTTAANPIDQSTSDYHMATNGTVITTSTTTSSARLLTTTTMATNGTVITTSTTTSSADTTSHGLDSTSMFPTTIQTPSDQSMSDPTSASQTTYHMATNGTVITTPATSDSADRTSHGLDTTSIFPTSIPTPSDQSMSDPTSASQTTYHMATNGTVITSPTTTDSADRTSHSLDTTSIFPTTNPNPSDQSMSDPTADTTPQVTTMTKVVTGRTSNILHSTTESFTDSGAPQTTGLMISDITLITTSSTTKSCNTSSPDLNITSRFPTTSRNPSDVSTDSTPTTSIRTYKVIPPSTSQASLQCSSTHFSTLTPTAKVIPPSTSNISQFSSTTTPHLTPTAKVIPPSTSNISQFSSTTTPHLTPTAKVIQPSTSNISQFSSTTTPHLTPTAKVIPLSTSNISQFSSTSYTSTMRSSTTNRTGATSQATQPRVPSSTTMTIPKTSKTNISTPTTRKTSSADGSLQRTSTDLYPIDHLWRISQIHRDAQGEIVSAATSPQQDNIELDRPCSRRFTHNTTDGIA
ncbi:hypothetical protein GDO81_028798 [Engystomops pustulosus]|uniref:Uncharacterized protein n=1 Tax=Engystomops pustulosus TaxID=76066 RepID=A0AAV6ZID7_ENGPU|nr:hypothetical protein GDO81_028798 [Engystomops pustulosus]